MEHPIFIKNASQLITVGGFSETPARKEKMKQLSIIENGAVWIESEKIISVGLTSELERKYSKQLHQAEVIDAAGKIVIPGLIDPHTHLVYAGSREDEFNLRLNGATYMEIMNSGGGIHSTTARTREATEEKLFKESKNRLDLFLLHGVTTVEAKSGYGLNWETEYKQLKVVKKLQRSHPIDVVSTFMGAHAVPREYKDCPELYVDLIINEMLPKVANENLAEFNDVFCERGVFTPDQSRRILEAGNRLGLKPKIHADEIEPCQGAELAAEIGAVSADHLLRASEQGIKEMAEKGVIGVLLPGTAFFLMTEAVNGRKMIDNGLAVALSTDCNPGSSPTVSLPLMMNLACLKMGLTPSEALIASTINAAHAISRGNEIGSIEEGKKADLVILNIPNYIQIQYYYGINHTDTVIKSGKIVVKDGRRC
ncbi:MAG: imidazolonepropionase [Bacillota bacterium]|nr:imidazolonepropionase [Bacillota bacterium]